MIPANPQSGRPALRMFSAARPAADLLLTARERERAGCIAEAIEQYESAIKQAEQNRERAVLAEALRRRAGVRHQRGERDLAKQLCNRSYNVASEIANHLLAGEALNTMGGMLRREGELSRARENFLLALDLGGSSRELRARLEWNLGVVAHIQGDLDEAQAHYTRSLESSQSSGDEHGCALAWHQLATVSKEKHRYDEADDYFRKTLDGAQRSGDVRLQGLCMLNHAEVHAGRQRFEEARQNAEAALAIFDQLGAKDHKASAYRLIGIVYRDTGRPALAESRLRSAIEMA